MSGKVVSSADPISEMFFRLIARKLVVSSLIHTHVSLEALPVDVEVNEGYLLTLTHVIASVFAN